MGVRGDDSAIRADLIALYEALDRELARIGPRCEISGRCCRFAQYGHMLFLSTVEAEYLAEAPPPGDVARSSQQCPYQQGVLCTARERRPLGCRVFFCDPAYAPFMQEIAERYTRALKAIVAKHGREWCYGPLPAILKTVLEAEGNGTTGGCSPAESAGATGSAVEGGADRSGGPRGTR